MNKGTPMPQVWQIAAGESGRFYDDLFLKHDIMFIGPGRFGPFDLKLYQEKREQGPLTSGKLGQLRGFVKRIRPGDVVLLRKVHKVVAIGVVSEEGYKWDDTFDDVYGWDLQHTRRVVWQGHLTTSLKQMQRSSKKEFFAHMKLIPTFTAVNDERLLRRIEPMLGRLKERPLNSMPEPIPEPLDSDELGELLFSKGIPNEAVDKVLIAIQRQRRMGKWYMQDGIKTSRPTEHEVVAHMILPLLLALGWSEQLLAVEWHKIDLAGFWGTPTTEDKCVLVCEAKGLGHGLQNVLEQAAKYVEDEELTECKKIMLTDGLRIYLYKRGRKRWEETPSGYFNVDKIRTNHIAPADTSAVDTLVALTPAGVMREVGK